MLFPLKVHIGRKETARERKERQQMIFEVERMVACDIEKYEDEWPQVGKIVSIEEQTVEVQWYTGTYSSVFKPVMLPVPGRRGDRQPWREKVLSAEILFSFSLTRGKKLPKDIAQRLKEIGST